MPEKTLHQLIDQLRDEIRQLIAVDHK